MTDPTKILDATQIFTRLKFSEQLIHQVIFSIRNETQLKKFIDMFGVVQTNKAEDIIKMIDYFNTSNSVPESLHLIRMQAAMNDENFMSEFNKLLGFEKLLTLIDRMQSKIEYAGLIPYCQQPVRSFSIDVGQIDQLSEELLQQIDKDMTYEQLLLDNVKLNEQAKDYSFSQKIMIQEQFVKGLVSFLRTMYDSEESNNIQLCINQYNPIVYSLYKLMVQTHSDEVRADALLLLNVLFNNSKDNTAVMFLIDAIQKYAVILGVKTFQPLYVVVKELIAKKTDIVVLQQTAQLMFALLGARYNPSFELRKYIREEFAHCVAIDTVLDSFIQIISVKNRVFIKVDQSITSSLKKVLNGELFFSQFIRDSKEVKELCDYFSKQNNFEGQPDYEELQYQFDFLRNFYMLVQDAARSQVNDKQYQYLCIDPFIKKNLYQYNGIKGTLKKVHETALSHNIIIQNHVWNSMNKLDLLLTENKKAAQEEPLMLSLIALDKFIEKLLIFSRNYVGKDAQKQAKDIQEKIRNEPIFNEDVMQLLMSGEVRDDYKIVSYMEFMFDMKYQDILKKHWEIYSGKKKMLTEAETLKQSELIDLQRQMIQRGSVKIVSAEFYQKHIDLDKVLKENEKQLYEKVKQVQRLSLQLAEFQETGTIQKTALSGPHSLNQSAQASAINTPQIQQIKQGFQSEKLSVKDRLASATLIANDAMMFASQLKKVKSGSDDEFTGEGLQRSSNVASQQPKPPQMPPTPTTLPTPSPFQSVNLLKPPTPMQMPAFLQPGSILQPPSKDSVNPFQKIELPAGIRQGVPPPVAISPALNMTPVAFPKLPPPAASGLPPGISALPPPSKIGLPPPPGISSLPQPPGKAGLPPPPSAAGLPPPPGMSGLPPPPGKIGLPPPPGSSVLPPPPGAGGLPPPPGMGGLPLPPGAGLPGMAAPQPQPQRAVVNVVPKDVKLKNFFWDKLRANDIKEFHIWKDVGRTDYKLDVETLTSLITEFSDKKKQIASDQLSTNVNTEVVDRSKEITFLDPKKSQQIGICLQKLKMTPQQVKSHILQLKNLLPNEHGIETLIAACPTAEEFATAQQSLQYEKNLGRYPRSEQFVIVLLDVQNLQKRLQNWLFSKQFDIELVDRRPVFAVFSKFYDFVLNSLAWKETLKILLTIGNILTANTAKGEAFGMKLKSLVSFCELKDVGGRNCLYHVVKIIQKFDSKRSNAQTVIAANENLANQLEDTLCKVSFVDFDYPLLPQLKIFISIIERMKKQNFDEESKEFDEFTNQLQFIVQSMDKFQTNNDEDHYCDIMSPFVSIALDKANSVAGTRNSCLNSYKQVLNVYCEKSGMKLNDFLAIFYLFVDTLKSNIIVMEQEDEKVERLKIQEQKDLLKQSKCDGSTGVQINRPSVQVSQNVKLSLDTLVSNTKTSKKAPTKQKANPLMSCTIIIQ